MTIETTSKIDQLLELAAEYGIDRTIAWLKASIAADKEMLRDVEPRAYTGKGNNKVML
jgi:hypothetical protein